MDIFNAIGFNKPYLTGLETQYISEAVESGKISGDGIFTKKCQDFFERQFGFKKVLLTTSCTDALEMAAILLDIKEGDEIIAPSYTFVSTVNAFVLRGAKIVFIDSYSDNPNLNVDLIESLITPKTKAIIPVHYAGFACDMKAIMSIANKYKLFVVEDAAQAINNFYINDEGQKIPLGSIGHLAAFSFHETKNIISGEGGMLVINDPQFIARAEIIREKGTNRSSFFRGEVDKYGWVDIGSSFLPSDIIAAFLWAQIENLEKIQLKRNHLYNLYHQKLIPLSSAGLFDLPKLPVYSANNAHMFYIICNSLSDRTNLINFLKEQKIYAVFHYLSLHKSPYYKDKHDGRELLNSDHFSDTILRMPIYYELTDQDVLRIITSIQDFFKYD